MSRIVFEDWQNELVGIATREMLILGWTEEQVRSYYGLDTFRDYFEEGYTPAATFAKDRFYAYDCVA